MENNHTAYKDPFAIYNETMSKIFDPDQMAKIENSVKAMRDLSFEFAQTLKTLQEMQTRYCHNAMKKMQENVREAFLSQKAPTLEELKNQINEGVKDQQEHSKKVVQLLSKKGSAMHEHIRRASSVNSPQQ